MVNKYQKDIEEIQSKIAIQLAENERLTANLSKLSEEMQRLCKAFFKLCMT